MSNYRYLTKSRYKLGIECPTKLFYSGKEEYPDIKMDDPFMEALAKGGYQVGELAKHYYPGGVDITTLDHDDAIKQTAELLEQDNVIIYEPAFRHKNLFIRIDVLVKKGNKFDLIEVKAKSIDSNDASPFFGSRGGLYAKWLPYLYDVAFQSHVLACAAPGASISNFLMLADKNAKCATNGLNQKFLITHEDNRKGIAVNTSLTEEDLRQKVLIPVNVDDVVKYIHAQNSSDGHTFEEHIEHLSNNYKADKKINPVVGTQCKKCEFTCTDDDEKAGLKSGFKECWSQALGWGDSDFEEPNILELWDNRSTDKMLQEGKNKFSDLSESDLKVKDDGKPGLSRTERQWMQVVKARDKEVDAYFDAEGMKAEMDKWIFPLHFIDFETTTVALPFTVGRKPYEGIAFQFSHHVYHEDGRIEHAAEYLNTERGIFPNFDFIRELKTALENDHGTIFRYADHENSFLNLICRQLEEMSVDIDDSKSLCEFIKTITHSTRSSKDKWSGDRDMVDMLKLVKRHYYDPATRGSNSIKDVLPAILNSSIFLQAKYSKPIYGANASIVSRNFKDWVWVEKEGEIVVDPYKKLPKLFQGVSDKGIELLSDEDELASGGAALMAYSKIQFEEISDYEREELEKALLKYCELDTFAMVMIYEAWLDMI